MGPCWQSALWLHTSLCLDGVSHPFTKGSSLHSMKTAGPNATRDYGVPLDASWAPCAWPEADPHNHLFLKEPRRNWATMESSLEPARFTAQDHPEVQGAKVHETEPEEACLGSPGEVAKPPIDPCNLYHIQCPSWGPLRSRKLTVPSNVSRDVLYGKILSAFMNPPL